MNIPVDTNNTGALICLFDKIAKALGACFSPWQTVRQARANAKVFAIEESGRQDALDIKVEREFRRNQNIISILEKTAEMSNGKMGSDKPIDIDWMGRWIDYAGGFSKDEVQTIWAKILIKEAEDPDSISLRTLASLNNMSRDEAMAFSRLTKYILHSGDSYYIFNGKIEIDQFDYDFGDLELAEEAGLINIDVSRAINYSKKTQPDDEDVFIEIAYQNLILKIPFANEINDMSLSVFPLTVVGRELYGIANQNEIDKDYLNLLIEYIKRRGLTCEIEYYNEIQ